MQEIILEYVRKLDLGTIIVMLVGVWLFTRNVKNELKTELKKEIEEVKSEIKIIHKDNKFFNTRLARTEGTVYGRNIYGVAPHEKEMD